MSQHAKLMPPSAEDRWLTCPGSPAMEERYGDEDTRSISADEGTAAHHIAALCLNDGVHPATYLKKQIIVGEVSATGDTAVMFEGDPDLANVWARNSFDVTTDMVAYINKYVRAIQAKAVGKELYVEQKMPTDWLTGEEGGVGTADAILIDWVTATLYVDDLKFGYRIVKVKDCKQLMTYALLALKRIDPDNTLIEHVVLTIHQPRVFDKPDSWSIPLTELKKFQVEVQEVAKTVRIAYQFRSNWLPGGLLPSQEYLRASEAACEYCRAKANCPTLAQAALSAVADSFVDLDADIVEQITPAISRAPDPDYLSRAYSALGIIDMFCSAIRAKVHATLTNGTTVPGYKLVRGRQGNREWTDEAQAEGALKSMALKQGEMYKQKLISPTDAEAFFGPKGSAASTKRWNRLQELIFRAPGKPVVAAEDDKREALAPVATLFDDLDDGSDLA